MRRDSGDIPFPVRSTPVPNRLIDEVLPTLRDTELRLLIVVVRSTLGWKGSTPGKRRASSWITHYELKRRTGRQSEAVSRAIHHLTQQRLIETFTLGGKPLSDSSSRRRCRGRILYRLGPSALV